MKLIKPAEHATANVAGVWRTRAVSGIYALALILSAVGAVHAATGDYTQQQAAAGHQVFAQHCAKCHGSKLQGQSGPPLAGPKFKSNLEFSKMSAQQLFAFIKSQMPYDAPGSLKKKQYLQALSYILSKNGYPQGTTPLSEKTLSKVKLLPYPGKGSDHQAHQANSKSQSQ
jgi:S-disulfanyl-L-cysteine oxidoreductase SoxD